MLVVAMSSKIFLHGYTAGGKAPEACFILWGLDEQNVWCNIGAWGAIASALSAYVREMLPDGFGYMAFSGVQNLRSHKGQMQEAMAFKVEPGCQFEVLPTTPGRIAKPEPQVNSDFLRFKSYTDQHRCFVGCKVHEHRGMIEASGKASERLLLNVCDVSGGMRRVTIWPPLHAEDGLWQVGNVVCILGCTASLHYGSFSVGSDCLAHLDFSVPSSQFPDIIKHTNWDAM